MRKTVPVLSLSLFCLLLAMGHNVQGQTDAQSRPSAIQRDVKLERAVSERYRSIKKLLQPEAQRKLAIASKALRKEMVKGLEPTDPYKLALAEVNKQFVELSAAQSELLSFYLLADVAQYATNLLEDSKKKEKPDSLSEMGEMESLRLQMAMDRLSKLMSTLSNLLKKSSEAASGITQNIK